jgi:hypothetical protein
MDTALLSALSSRLERGGKRRLVGPEGCASSLFVDVLQRHEVRKPSSFGLRNKGTTAAAAAAAAAATTIRRRSFKDGEKEEEEEEEALSR